MGKLCNGIKSPRVHYSEAKKKALIPMIEKTRQDLLKEVGVRDDKTELFAGNRFNDNDSVFARLESANQDNVIFAGWHQAIRCALLDCMSSDYYYLFEKDYGGVD